MIKKHSEHKGPAPPPPLSQQSKQNNEPSQIVNNELRIENPSENNKHIELVVDESSKSKSCEELKTNDSVNNNLELSKLSSDVDEKISMCIQNIDLPEHNTIIPKQISVVSDSDNSLFSNSVIEIPAGTRRSSSTSNRNQRRPSPPSLDKVLQMNKITEKNGESLLSFVENESSDQLKTNENDQLKMNENDQNNDNGTF